MAAAVRTADFWLILAGATLILSSVNAVIQHFILFLRDQGYSIRTASDFLSALLVSSLVGRVLVGYIADRFRKKNTMALFYLVLGASIPLLYLAHQPIAAFAFAITFGFSMGADYMLIPLVTAERFGLASLGKLLALIIMGYTIGQWIAPWMAGKIFDTYHTVIDWPGPSLPARACWARERFTRCRLLRLRLERSLGAHRNEPPTSSTSAPVGHLPV